MSSKYMCKGSRNEKTVDGFYLQIHMALYYWYYACYLNFTISTYYTKADWYDYGWFKYTNTPIVRAD